MRGVILLPALLGLGGALVAASRASLAGRMRWLMLALLLIGAMLVSLLVMRALSVAHLFALPFARALMGATAPLPALQPMFCEADLPATGRRTEFLRCRFTDAGVMPVAVQDSSALGALAGADALLLRPAGAAAVAKVWAAGKEQGLRRFREGGF